MLVSLFSSGPMARSAPPPRPGVLRSVAHSHTRAAASTLAVAIATSALIRLLILASPTSPSHPSLPPSLSMTAPPGHPEPAPSLPSPYTAAGTLAPVDRRGNAARQRPPRRRGRERRGGGLRPARRAPAGPAPPHRPRPARLLKPPQRPRGRREALHLPGGRRARRRRDVPRHGTRIHPARIPRVIYVYQLLAIGFHVSLQFVDRWWLPFL